MAKYKFASWCRNTYDAIKRDKQLFELWENGVVSCPKVIMEWVKNNHAEDYYSMYGIGHQEFIDWMNFLGYRR